MREFKAGDKVYYPLKSNKVLTLQENESTFDYPLLAKGFSFTSDGKYRSIDISPSLFHATPENHALLERLYGVEFEKPSVKPTSREIIEAMLERGDKCVPCWASDHRENPGVESAWVCIVGCSDGCYPFALSNGGGWKYATPFDRKTGKPITELPE